MNTDAEIKNCRCGCGEVAKTYKPGHDARHASAVGRAVAYGLALGWSQPTARLTELGSISLRSKALRQAGKIYAANPGTETSDPTVANGLIKRRHEADGFSPLY
jgi:hypothetical protein